MRIPDNLAMILLALYLIIVGVLELTGGGAVGIILGLLALAAGILLLMQYLRR